MKHLLMLLLQNLLMTLMTCSTNPTSQHEDARHEDARREDARHEDARHEDARHDADSSFNEGAFGYDAHFLHKQDPQLVTLWSEDRQAGVIVSPKYQAKVFTSTAKGMEGLSYGWVNYQLLASNKKVPHMNGYGGEDRFWIGPEGGQYSVFFEPGAEMVYDHWYTPPAIDTEPFQPVGQDAQAIHLQKEMQLKNYAGHTFHLLADRTITLLSAKQSAQLLDTKLPQGVSFVGYESKNSITNQGDSAWTEDTGAICIWILGMFRPSATATVVIPYQQGDASRLGPVATTDYFGQIPPDRLKEEGVIYFKVDGKERGKLGLTSQRAKGIAGSYDEANQVLTLVQYTFSEGERYVNQRWEQQQQPFQGDVLNAYNDGPLEDGSQMGPFFEIESSSPAAFLKPGQQITHFHRTFHFSGEEQQLDKLARETLGVGLQTIKKVF